MAKCHTYISQFLQGGFITALLQCFDAALKVASLQQVLLMGVLHPLLKCMQVRLVLVHAFLQLLLKEDILVLLRHQLIPEILDTGVCSGGYCLL